MKKAQVFVLGLASIAAAAPKPSANRQADSVPCHTSSVIVPINLVPRSLVSTSTENGKISPKPSTSLSTIYSTFTAYSTSTSCYRKSCSIHSSPISTSISPVSTITFDVIWTTMTSRSTLFSTSTIESTSTLCSGKSCHVISNPVRTSVIPLSTIMWTTTSTYLTVRSTQLTSGTYKSTTAPVLSSTASSTLGSSLTTVKSATSSSSSILMSYTTTLSTTSSTATLSTTSSSTTLPTTSSTTNLSTTSSTTILSTTSSTTTTVSTTSSTATLSTISQVSLSDSSTASITNTGAQNTSSTFIASTVTTNSSTTSSSATATGTPCAGNSASDRSVWCNYDTSTDYYNVVPDTGVTREYWFDLTQVTVEPDGVSRLALAVNGSIPGPTIIADWGDEVIVHVANSLTESHNGSSIHFHGIRQNYTNQADGVVSVTQCPTAPGDTYTYKWRATQYGSSWYHSHFGLQAWEGVLGGILINGPATANYDVDLGNLFIQDWSHETADELYVTAELEGAIALDTGLINGTNVFGEDDATNQTGTRFSAIFDSGSSYLIRLVNVAIDTHFKFSIDNHTMTVIASDFVPIIPYTTTVLSIAMGQRYDIIVTADQSSIASDFWMRAIPQISCSDNDSVDNIKGIVHYGTSTNTPSTTGYDYIDECVDETDLVPYVSKTVGSVTLEADEAVSVTENSENYFRWTLNGTSMLIDWNDPTLLQVYDNATASSFSNTSNLISVPNANEWVYVVITEVLPVAHPIHLHGHDFYVIASGSDTYNSSTVTLNLSNPPRRDVALLQSAGYLVLAFETDNPGAWLMHCHIGWHTLEGFALQFLERESEIISNGLIDYDSMNSTCSNWNSYASADDVVQTDDSGI